MSDHCLDCDGWINHEPGTEGFYIERGTEVYDYDRRLIYADWLEEHGYPKSAQYHRALVQELKEHLVYDQRG